MFRIIKFMRSCILQVIVILALLFVQAWGDLSLPQYTSDIVDIGIQQGGIENAAANVLTADSYNDISLFLNEDDRELLKDSYTFVSPENASDSEKELYPLLNTEGLYLLNDMSDKQKEKLSETLSLSMTVCGTLYSLTLDDFTALIASFGVLPDSAVNTIKSFKSFDEITALTGNPVNNANALDAMIALLSMPGVNTDVNPDGFVPEGMPEAMINQTAVQFVKSEYERVGVDMEALQMNYLFFKGAAMVGIALIMMTVAILVGFFASRVAAKVGRDLRSKVFKNVVAFSNAEIDKFSTASLITRCTNDVQQIQMVVVLLLRMIMYAPILGIGGIIKVVSAKTNMAWIIAIAVVAILCLVIILMNVAMPKFKAMQKLVDKLNLVSREILTGLPVIRAFSREKYEEQRFDDANKELTSTMLFTNRVMTFMMPAMMLIMNLITVLILWVGAKGIGDGTLQVGDMMAFITYTMQIVMSFLMLTMVAVMLPRATVSAERIDEVICTHSSIKDKKDACKLSKADTSGEVVFNNVSFHYPDANENVISNISFTAKPGQTTAIIGSTGSGKSTLVHLIPRYYDVTEGSISIDGKDIRDYTQGSLRELIGFVPQKGVLFSGTIKSNIKFADENISDEQMELAAEISQSEEFISSKPEKYDSVISQGGTNVSGGQKQRLSIARAIAKNPKIYIFDDSFSALDFKTDAKLRKALGEKTSDSTVIIVAQRISTILNAEQIIVLDEGKIAGIGTHSELISSCEVYKQIAVSQLSANDLEQIENNVKGASDNG